MASTRIRELCGGKKGLIKGQIKNFHDGLVILKNEEKRFGCQASEENGAL